MSTTPEADTRVRQLPLPLPEAVAAPDPVAASDPVDTGAEDDRSWRLDEHTRRIGRRGIADARARLRSSAGRAA
jgi:hypothetical protein